jgi:TolA-binding protein
MKNILIVFLAICVPYNLLCAEPSAFGAGDLNNPTPYGLTSGEEVILSNKKNLHQVVIKSNNQANEMSSIRERVDGLQTIIESLSMISRDNKLKLKSIDKENVEQLENNSEYEKRVAESVLVNSKEIEKMDSLMIEISKITDKINATYITKKEFNALIDDVNKFKDLVAKELQNTTKSKVKKSKFDNISNFDLEKKAKSYYEKQFYTKAIEYYNYLIKENYKPARAYYMIGEMNYYRKNYADSIAYFKKSTSLYSRASYMPVLMLHTAISMQKTGDTEKAKTFYEALIIKYPNSDSAKIAQERLNLL